MHPNANHARFVLCQVVTTRGSCTLAPTPALVTPGSRKVYTEKAGEE